MDMLDVAEILRAMPRAKPQPKPAPAMVEDVPAIPKSIRGPMIEFIKDNRGLTQSIDVRTNGRVRTLVVNRDADDNILNATLVKESR